MCGASGGNRLPEIAWCSAEIGGLRAKHDGPGQVWQAIGAYTNLRALRQYSAPLPRNPSAPAASHAFAVCAVDTRLPSSRLFSESSGGNPLHLADGLLPSTVMTELWLTSMAPICGGLARSGPPARQDRARARKTAASGLNYRARRLGPERRIHFPCQHGLVSRAPADPLMSASGGGG